MNIREIFTEFESILQKGISEEDMERFRSVLIKICENFEEKLPQENQL